MNEISRKRISFGFLKLDEITYESNGKILKKECIHRGDAVAGLLYNTRTEKYIFVKQFRPGVGAELIEIIAGTMDVEGETPELCLKREVLEETTFLVTSCKLICSAYSSPGSLTEKIHIFQAITDGTKIGNSIGVGDEEIEIVEFSKSEIVQNIEILSQDLKTFIAVMNEMNVKRI